MAGLSVVPQGGTHLDSSYVFVIWSMPVSIGNLNGGVYEVTVLRACSMLFSN